MNSPKNTKIDIVILAGGKGSRLKLITKNKIPKPLVEINNKPFLDFLLNHLTKFQIKNILILCGYKGNQIYKKYHNKIINGKKIICIIEKKKMGTAGALNQLKNKVSKFFFLVNGDTFFNINLDQLIKKFNKKYYLMMVLTKQYKESKTTKLLNIKLNKNNEVVIKKSNLINSGTYILSNKILNFLNKKNQSLESEIIPKLLKLKKVMGIKSRSKFIDIGTPENFKKSKKILIR